MKKLGKKKKRNLKFLLLQNGKYYEKNPSQLTIEELENMRKEA